MGCHFPSGESQEQQPPDLPAADETVWDAGRDREHHGTVQGDFYQASAAGNYRVGKGGLREG